MGAVMNFQKCLENATSITHTHKKRIRNPTFSRVGKNHFPLQMNTLLDIFEAFLSSYPK